MFTHDQTLIPQAARYAGSTYGGELSEFVDDLLQEAEQIFVLAEKDGEKSYFIL
jgi:hypothetical protein